MRELNDRTRIILLATGALEVNEEGDEVLAGLTLAESAFFIMCGQEDRDELDAGERFLFNQLKHRHLEARLQKLNQHFC